MLGELVNDPTPIDCCSSCRMKVLETTDRRVQLMSEIVKSMRIVKMYCWESAFARKIYSIRRLIMMHLNV